MSENKQYEKKYKVQAVKLAKRGKCGLRRVRMYQAFKYRKKVGKFDGIKIPCEATVRRHY